MDMWAAIARVLASVANDLLRDILAVAVAASILWIWSRCNLSRPSGVPQNLGMRTTIT